jgi:predicted membrane protein
MTMLGKDKNRKIADHIFNGSITMSGVCVTIIALFRVMKIGIVTYADEILSLNTFIFLAATMFSYISLRKENNQLSEKLADILFFTGMISMIIVGLIVVYTAY